MRGRVGTVAIKKSIGIGSDTRDEDGQEEQPVWQEAEVAFMMSMSTCTPLLINLFATSQHTHYTWLSVC